MTLKLKDALGGGNSKLLIVACISTALKDLAETKETLRFAEMARSITNTPTINREPKDELIERLRLEIEELHDQLNLAARGANPEKMLQQQLNALEAAYAELQEELVRQSSRSMHQHHAQGSSPVLFFATPGRSSVCSANPSGSGAAVMCGQE